MRLCRRRRLFASVCGSNGSSPEVHPLRWRSHAGGPYTACSVARNEGRALLKILVVNLAHCCYDDLVTCTAGCPLRPSGVLAIVAFSKSLPMMPPLCVPSVSTPPAGVNHLPMIVEM